MGKSLADFQLPGKLSLMSPGTVRYKYKERWYRAAAQQAAHSGLAHQAQDSSLELALDSGQAVGESEPLGHLEMALDCKWDDIPVFLLSLDQKQSQWSAYHFLADTERGLGICCSFRGDKYHRSWRDFQSAMSRAEGGFAD